MYHNGGSSILEAAADLAHSVIVHFRSRYEQTFLLKVMSRGQDFCHNIKTKKTHGIGRYCKWILALHYHHNSYQ